MKLDNNSQVYINCRTQEEQDMIKDLLISLNMRWNGGKALNQISLMRVPMFIEICNCRIRHGSGVGKRMNVPFDYPILEASDFKNQWIALKRGLDK